MFNISITDICDYSRSSSLQLGRNKLKTPCYGLIHTDMKRLNHGSNLIGVKPPKVAFHEIVIDHDINIEKNIEIFENRINNNYKSDLPNLCQFRASSDITLSKEKLRYIIEIQMRTEKLSVITIPDPIIKDSSILWEKTMNDALNIANEAYETGLTYVIMPTISLDQPIKHVEKKIKWLMKKKIKSLGLRATGQFSPRLHKATEIINKYEELIWIHLFDIKKKYLEVSQVHLASLVTVDTISPKKKYSRTKYHASSRREFDQSSSDFPTPIGIPLEPEIPIAIMKEEHRDLFEARALGFLTQEEIIKSFGHELTCRCPICQKTRSIEELEVLLSRMDRASLLQVHETVSYSEEFNNIKDAIHQNDLLSYYNNKSLIKENKKKIAEKFPNLKKPRFKRLW